MISPRNRKLARKLIILAVIAGGLWVILGLTNLTSAPKSSLHADMGKPVLADFNQARSEASRIRFTLADESYTLARTADGWVMELSLIHI